MRDNDMKAIFLDRDGTINVDTGFLCSPDELVYKENAIEGLKKFRDDGYELIIVTNQSGIARGYYSEEQFRLFQSWMISDLKKRGVTILDYYYCPHYPGGVIPRYSIKCECRKPATLLYEQAIRKYDIDMKRSYAIGDRIRDLSISEKTPIQGIMINGNIEEVKSAKSKGITVCEDLLDAFFWVQKNSQL